MNIYKNNHMVNVKDPSFAGKIQVHWNISSNALCNYMREQNYLNMILKNRAIIPRYITEDVSYLNLEGYSQICFPMTCFCDIPFSKVQSHMKTYGKFGIGFSKESLMKRSNVQPIQYVNNISSLASDFSEAFNKALEMNENDTARYIAGYLSSSLMFMKPIYGYSKNDNKFYTYQDECEWRFIPSENFPKDHLHLILNKNENTDKGKEIYNQVLREHPECWFKFEWDEVLYIIVPDEEAVKHTIKFIRELDDSVIKDDEKDMLISKIEISRQFADNM